MTVMRFRPWVRRLSDESGIALFLALAVILVITVMVTSVLAFHERRLARRESRHGQPEGLRGR
jgi:hypothetical protein